ncbi:MAG: hypothetical protein AAFR56_01615 [Chloroflexota bacterium]
MHRFIAAALLILALAACGSQPEQVIPTRIVIETDTPDPALPTADGEAAVADAATLPPQPPTLPPPPDERNVVATREGDQYLVVSMAGALAAPDSFVPGDLYVVGGVPEVARITVSEANDSDPVWNLDRSGIYFVSDREGTPYIYTVNADNSNPVSRVAPFDTDDQREPTLSPFGDEIAFTTSRNGNDDIYAMTSDGRAPRQLTAGPANESQPDWSPDNTWITFVSDRDGNPEIYIMDTQGGQVTRLTDSPGVDHQPAFSPDGRQIVFISDRNNGVPQVFIINLPVPMPSFDEDNRGVAVDITAGQIPPLELDISAPPQSPLQITGDRFAKTAPDWFVDDEGGFRLTYTSLQNPDGTRGYVYASTGLGGTAELVHDFDFSFTGAAAR